MNLTRESLGGTRMVHISQDCAQCGTHTRCRRRDFSPQTWSVLLIWGEVEKEAVDRPVCDECYVDLRDIMIDRADDVAEALSQPAREQSASAGKSTKQTADKTSSTSKKKAGKKQKKRTSKVA